MKGRKTLLIALSSIAAVTAVAFLGGGAPWSDDFESYPLGPIAGQGGWEEWTGSQNVSGQVTNAQAHSGSKSLLIEGGVSGGDGGDDTVQRFSGLTTGRYLMKAWTFVPSTATGAGWFIMLNQYPQPLNWSHQVNFNADTNKVTADFQQGETDLVKGQWVPYMVDINLDTDKQHTYYNGVPFVIGQSWKDGVSGMGISNIAALDLYGGEFNSNPPGTSGMYFDDITLAVVPTIADVTFQSPGGGNAGGTIADLADLDDSVYRTFSDFTSEIQFANLTAMVVGMNTSVATPNKLCVTIKAKINQSVGGFLRVAFRDWNTGEFVDVGPVFQTTTDFQFFHVENVPAGNFVRASDGRIEMRVRSYVNLPISEATFFTEFDLVQVGVS
ncbi:MAG: hypothetical protein KatS3mg015_0015 [Fimbriimonadales bacterium]|nr:MAG: hypothetical protein KatS3mg015_0015 [Fimbriimonadales bacterium]